MYSLFLFFGVLLVPIGLITCYLGKMKAVNSFMGFRFGATMRDPEIWKVVNIHTGIIFIIHGVITGIAGLTLSKVDFTGLFLVLVFPLLLQMFYGIWLAYRLEKRSPQQNGEMQHTKTNKQW